MVPYFTCDHWVVLYVLVCVGSVNPDHFDFRRYTTLDAYVDGLLAILDALRAERCAFAGHSVSATIGILAAIRRSELFTKLVLPGASPGINPCLDIHSQPERHLLQVLQKLVVLRRLKFLVHQIAMITGLGSHGLGSTAIELFEEMLSKGIKPDEATFSALLCACCYSELVEDARVLFRRMQGEFGIHAQTEHYVYTVKVLEMAGELHEAHELIRSMPILPDAAIWGALLWCCNVHGDFELAEIVALQLFEIEPQKTAYRVILSNMHAAEGNWVEVENLRGDITEFGIGKMPGLSWIGDDKM